MGQHMLSLHNRRSRFETKEHDPATSDPEFKKLWDGFLKNFDDFKKANDERFKGLVLKDGVDTLVEEKVSKINAAMVDQQKLIDAAIAEFKRAPLTTKDDGGLNPDQRAYSKGFQEFMRKGKEPDNMYELAEKAFPQYKALMAGSNPDGGWLTSPEVDNQIYRVAQKIITFRSLASVRQVGASSFQKIVSLGGAGSGWVGETSPRPETSTPTLETLNFSVGEIYAMPLATQTILDDANINIEQWLADEVAIEFAEKENAAFISGNGAVGKPKGVLSYPMVIETVGGASAPWGSVGYVKTGGAADFAAANPADSILNLIGALKTKFRNGAKFIMNRATAVTMRKFKDTAGGTYLWQPGMQAGEPSLIWGYPFVEDDDWPAAGANAFMMGFGNWSQAYLIVDRMGIRVLRDPYTQKPYVKFYTTKRVGGGVQNFEAFKLLKAEA